MIHDSVKIGPAIELCTLLKNVFLREFETYLLGYLRQISSIWQKAQSIQFNKVEKCKKEKRDGDLQIS